MKVFLPQPTAAVIRSRNHDLNKIHFPWTRSRVWTPDQAGFSIWFSKDLILLQKLAQFKASEKMRCRVRDPPSDYCLGDAKDVVYKKALDNYQELKVKLAAAYRLKRGQIDSSSAKNGFKSDSLSQFGTSS